jgi:hypothetical protein
MIYSYAGLRIRSPIPVAGQEISGEADVDVCLGPVSPRLQNPVIEGARFQGQPGRWLCWPRRGCRVEVFDGRRVVMELAEGFSPRWAQIALEQAVVVLLHMRGFLPVHASAVESGGRAWLFLGPNMVGKSSLAFALMAAGLTVVSDDLCAVSSAQLLGGTGVLKVPLALCGDSPGSLELVGDRRERRALSLAEICTTPLAIGGMFVLSAEGGVIPALRSLSPPEAVQALLRHSYGPTFARAFGTQRRYFLDCSRLVGQVPFRHLSVPAGAAGSVATAGWLLEQGALK